MKIIYKIYRDRLVEITGKSRSLYSRNLSKKQAYNLGKLFENNHPEAEDFRDFLWNNNGRHFRMLTDEQVTPHLKELKLDALAPAQKRKFIETEEKNFVQLNREIEEIRRDTGKYELFVGYPFVEGTIGKNVTVKAPLLLFPAKISTDKDIDIILLKNEPVQLNKVFLLAYSRETRTNIENITMEFDEIANHFSSVADVRNYLASHGIKIKQGAGKKVITDIELAKEHLGDLEIRNFCVLGRFPLANSIYYDYNELFKKKLVSPTISALLDNTEIKVKDKKQNEFFITNSLDYAQEQAVEKAEKLKHMVIYGPPGTGKSQTIAGMIADNLCKNKRVLVVSQKRAALDVVFHRLGPINSKAVILPDPEKNKIDFYNKVKARYEQILTYKAQFNKTAYDKCVNELNAETAELQALNDVLFSETSFGLTLQRMYSLSSNIGKNSADYMTYTAMLRSEIIKMNYPELADACNAISQRNKGKLFYDYQRLSKSNPLINYIKTDLDVHTINQAKSFLAKLISREHVPFNVAQFTYSRYMLAYNLEQHDNKSLKPLASMITQNENPRLHGALKFTYFPLFWPGLPFTAAKYNKRRKTVQNKLETAENAVKHFVNEFSLLKTVLESEGLALVMDNIAYGNDKFLKKLMTALDDYVSVRAMRLAADSITEVEQMLINFATENSRTQNEFFYVLDRILPIRIYHEVIEHEKRKEQLLSKTIIYEDLRNRITQLKAQHRKMAALLAQDTFNDECKQLLNQRPEQTKDFLHQINKQRGHWPVRRLLEHFEGLLLKMFPCWLLSPEAVSSVLPLKQNLFDVVMFDEASQLFIESTLPAVYRAGAIVVAGDNKQLKPTSVFVKRYMGDDTYDSDTSLNTQALMEVESLLDLASSRLKTTHLTYHYRSCHEELINFSNYAFYSGNLQIAPNASKNTSFLPIERVKVNGKWRGRHNHEEARAIVNIVKNIFKTRKANESIGIVTFNTEQEEYIKDLLDKECAASAQFKQNYLNELNRTENGEDTSLFVKNLENVQGDERDIIIFSIAYARNEEGRLTSQFGTLSMPGGENRLNVAITRAIKKIYVVTSVEPEEFTNISNTKNDGPKLLVKYLQYARAVSQKNGEDVKKILDSLAIVQKPESPEIGDLEKTIKKELEKMGHTVEINLGNADYKISLAVYDETLDRYLLGIECDYTAHNSSVSMMERDVYRIEFLQARGWDIMRVWSRDWWFNKNALIKQIENRINANRKRLMDEYGIREEKKPTKQKATPTQNDSATLPEQEKTAGEDSVANISDKEKKVKSTARNPKKSTPSDEAAASKSEN